MMTSMQPVEKKQSSSCVPSGNSNQISKVFEDLGCKAAYIPEGGHCSFMTMKNQVANHPYKPEHEVKDVIFITDRNLLKKSWGLQWLLHIQQ